MLSPLRLRLVAKLWRIMWGFKCLPSMRCDCLLKYSHTLFLLMLNMRSFSFIRFSLRMVSSSAVFVLMGLS